MLRVSSTVKLDHPPGKLYKLVLAVNMVIATVSLSTIRNFPRALQEVAVSLFGQASSKNDRIRAACCASHDHSMAAGVEALVR